MKYSVFNALEWKLEIRFRGYKLIRIHIKLFIMGTHHLHEVGLEDHVKETQQRHGVDDANQHPTQIEVLALLGQKGGQGERDEGDEGARKGRQDYCRIYAAYIAEERSERLAGAESEGVEHAQTCIIVLAVILVEVQTQD